MVSFPSFLILLLFFTSNIPHRKAQGHVKAELPYEAVFGVIGSWYGFILNIICLAATFYTALYPPGGSPNAQNFFSYYLAAPIVLALYVGWKVTHMGPMWIPALEMDIDSQRRSLDLDPDNMPEPKTWANMPMRAVRALF